MKKYLGNNTLLKTTNVLIQNNYIDINGREVAHRYLFTFPPPGSVPRSKKKKGICLHITMVENITCIR